jgi:two-component system chemotaxis sensor kinase CheA
LSVAREAVVELDGTIDLRVVPGGGTRIEMSVPLSIVTRRLLLVRFRDQQFGIPCDAVVRVLRASVADIITLEARPAVLNDGAPVPLRSLGELLDPPEATVATEGARSIVVILRAAAGKIGLVVEDVGAVGDFAVRPLDVATGERRFWSGITLSPDGLRSLVLGSGALAHLAARAPVSLTFDQRERRAPVTPWVLVVDDSVTTRTLEKSILEAEGYAVRLSVDGADAIAQLRAEPVDVVVSDIEMPRLDGFELLRAMRSDERLAEIPVILVTSRENSADRERGMELGADAYVVKQRFDQAELLKTIRQVI